MPGASRPSGRMHRVQSFIQHHLESSGYAALFVLAFLGAMCIPIPSELTFGIAGALCSASFAAPGATPLHLWAVIVVGIVASVCGASVAYAVGRFGGRTFVDRYGKYVLLSHEDLDRAEHLFGRWGDGLVAVGQVASRSFAPSSGSSRAWPRCAGSPSWPSRTLGAAAWVSLISVIGYEAGD